jgi:tetratricopeptide (TPR) repeat protein
LISIVDAYNKALAIKPDYAEAYYNMGLALKDQGKLEEAIEAYKQSSSLSSLIMLRPTTTWAMLSKSKVSWKRL